MKCWALDLDDTCANTTRDLMGDPSRVLLLTLVPGVREFLESTRARGDARVLVTVGDWPLQMRKLKHLRIDFDRYVILPNMRPKEEPGFWEKAPNSEKEVIFTQLAAQYTDPAVGKVVIGDRLDREITLGKSLGFTTVRMRLPEGKYSNFEPQSEAEIPDFTVQDFFELMDLPIFNEQ